MICKLALGLSAESGDNGTSVEKNTSKDFYSKRKQVEKIGTRDKEKDKNR